MDRNENLRLSKNILEMKFMKKTKAKVENLEFQKEGEEYFENVLTSRMKKESGNYIMEQSFVFCEGLIEGRFSFHGVNPEIEKLMEIENAKKQEEMEKSKETDVSDESMVKWKVAMKHKISKDNKRNNKNRNKSFASDEPNVKKLKFLKPSD